MKTQINKNNNKKPCTHKQSLSFNNHKTSENSSILTSNMHNSNSRNYLNTNNSNNTQHSYVNYTKHNYVKKNNTIYSNNKIDKFKTANSKSKITDNDNKLESKEVSQKKNLIDINNNKNKLNINNKHKITKTINLGTAKEFNLVNIKKNINSNCNNNNNNNNNNLFLKKNNTIDHESIFLQKGNVILGDYKNNFLKLTNFNNTNKIDAKDLTCNLYNNTTVPTECSIKNNSSNNKKLSLKTFFKDCNNLSVNKANADSNSSFICYSSKYKIENQHNKSKSIKYQLNDNSAEKTNSNIKNKIHDEIFRKIGLNDRKVSAYNNNSSSNLLNYEFENLYNKKEEINKPLVIKENVSNKSVYYNSINNINNNNNTNLKNESNKSNKLLFKSGKGASSMVSSNFNNITNNNNDNCSTLSKNVLYINNINQSKEKKSNNNELYENSKINAKNKLNNNPATSRNRQQSYDINTINNISKTIINKEQKECKNLINNKDKIISFKTIDYSNNNKSKKLLNNSIENIKQKLNNELKSNRLNINDRILSARGVENDKLSFIINMKNSKTYSNNIDITNNIDSTKLNKNNRNNIKILNHFRNYSLEAADNTGKETDRLRNNYTNQLKSQSLISKLLELNKNELQEIKSKNNFNTNSIGINKKIETINKDNKKINQYNNNNNETNISHDNLCNNSTATFKPDNNYDTSNKGLNNNFVFHLNVNLQHNNNGNKLTLDNIEPNNKININSDLISCNSNNFNNLNKSCVSSDSKSNCVYTPNFKQSVDINKADSVFNEDDLNKYKRNTDMFNTFSNENVNKEILFNKDLLITNKKVSTVNIENNNNNNSNSNSDIKELNLLSSSFGNNITFADKDKNTFVDQYNKPIINNENNNNIYNNIKSTNNESTNKTNIIYSNYKKVVSKYSLIQPGYINNTSKLCQDNCFLFTNFNNNHECILFGILDGHGDNGHHISDLIKNNLPKRLDKELILNGIQFKDNKIVNTKSLSNDKLTTTLKELIQIVFNNTNELINKKIDATFSGSTCSLGVLYSNYLITANLGDSRIIKGKLINNGWNYIDLTRDHKPTERDEYNRIISNNGEVRKINAASMNISYIKEIGPFRLFKKNENYPGLAMSRSFGDTASDNIGKSSIPEIEVYTLDINDKFIFAASDGIWDVMSSIEVR